MVQSQPSFTAMLDRARSANREVQGAVRRALAVLQLAGGCPADALESEIAAELADQRRCGLETLRSLPPGPALERARAALAGDDFRDGLEALPQESTGLTEALAGIIDRHDRFVARLGWVLDPATPEAVERLDPVRDRDQIHHALSYSLRTEQPFCAFLSQAHAGLQPAECMLYGVTGETSARGRQRFIDTSLLIATALEWGSATCRGREAIARINQIHARYAIPNEAMRFTLGAAIFLPILWNERVGWRRMTGKERLGWFHAYIAFGRELHISGLSDDYETELAWWRAANERLLESTKFGMQSLLEFLIPVVAALPADLRQAAVTALFAGLDETTRQVVGLPPPPATVLDEVRAWLRALGAAADALPRAPWAVAFRLGDADTRPGQVGVGDRAPQMPKAVCPFGHGARPNGGHPDDRRPVEAAAELQPLDLPEVTMDEVARHAAPADAWIVIDGWVYDIARLQHFHPGGGAVLLRWAGKDASEAFHATGHSNVARVLAVNFRIARVASVQPRELPAVEKPGGNIHTGRRSGRGRVYPAEDWPRLIASVCELAARYANEPPRPLAESFPFGLGELAFGARPPAARSPPANLKPEASAELAGP